MNARHHASQHVRHLALLETRAAKTNRYYIFLSDERVLIWTAMSIKASLHSLVLRRRIYDSSV